MYNQEISRTKPTLFCFLIDQSQSMWQESSTGMSSAEAVRDIINKFIANTVTECSRNGEVRDYFYISVIWYGNEQDVSYAFEWDLANKDIIPISEIADHPLRVEDRQKKESDWAGGIIDIAVKFPVWFDAKAYGMTPMRQAFELAKEAVEKFIGVFPDSYPPAILNITDGESTDGDPSDIAEQIKQLWTSDWNALVYNAHLDVFWASSAIKFPSKLQVNRWNAKMLFDMSSSLPDSSIEIAKRNGNDIEAWAKWYVYNADLADLIKFIDIGTRRWSDALPNHAE